MSELNAGPLSLDEDGCGPRWRPSPGSGRVCRRVSSGSVEVDKSKQASCWDHATQRGSRALKSHDVTKYNVVFRVLSKLYLSKHVTSCE